MNKIFIEICQLLFIKLFRLKILFIFLLTYKKIYNIHPTLAPFKWACKSLGNYKYLINLADSLLLEYFKIIVTFKIINLEEVLMLVEKIYPIILNLNF